MLFCGIDIGGTKCSVTLGKYTDDNIYIVQKDMFSTPATPDLAVSKLLSSLRALLASSDEDLTAIGVSCGSPMDSEKGLILSPPNLPNWDSIDIISPFREEFGVPVSLCNDANACALAEYNFGAGKGTQNMIFLTFGTGLGAGLILNGKLYCGSSDMAGEIGHIRLAQDGPLGYGKNGSFEGFCSGGGIARYGQDCVRQWLSAQKTTSILHDGVMLQNVTCKDIFLAANNHDELACRIVDEVGDKLGYGVAMLMDIFNPDAIVIGGVYPRQKHLLSVPMTEAIKREALSYTRRICKVLPSALGEFIGDYAALAVAYRSICK